VSDSKTVITKERFYNERQLKQLLPEMEEERKDWITTLSNTEHVDSEGVALVTRICDTYMGSLIAYVRMRHGGLVPYFYRYYLAEDMASPSKAHQLTFGYLDVNTREEITLAQFAVVHLPNDLDEIKSVGLDREKVSQTNSECMGAINTMYIEHLAETGIDESVPAWLFYVPYLAVLKACLTGSSDPLPVEDLMSPLTVDKLFLPMEFHFDTDSKDPDEHVIVARIGQPSDSPTILAIEARFYLNALAKVAAIDAVFEATEPSSQSIH
jgi:hypothetical protein